MRLTQFQNNYLYEGLDRSATQTMMLWESAGFKLKEAALTADQIQQIFQSVEKSATDAGSNRTMLGKGKDATVAIKKAYDDLVSKVQSSGPVKGADAMYDGAVAKIEAGLGGPDNAVNKVIQKYRKFAKEHPVAQGLIYSILIAAAGISGVGLGGAAVLGLLKMTDKLLQGEKFSTAVGKGLATGATAFAAGQIGQALKGTPADIPPGGDAAATVAKGGARAARDAIAKGALDSADKYINSGSITDYNSIGDAVAEIMSNYEGTAQISAQSLKSIEEMVRTKLMAGLVNGNGVIQGGKAVAKAAVGDSIIYTGKKLSEGQVYMIFNRIAAKEQLTEGPMDFIKGAAAKGMDKLKTVGKNLTTKVTADKLNSAWTKAGSPTDSAEVAKVITSAGVGDDVVTQVYTDLKLPSPTGEAPGKPKPGEKGYYGKGDPEQTKIAVAKMSDEKLQSFVSKATDPDNPHVQIAKAELEKRKSGSGGSSSATPYLQVKDQISKLDKKGRQRLTVYLQKQLGTA